MLQTGCASMGLTSLVNTLAQLKLTGAAAAQGAGGDYKALVCLFFNGGNDSNNMLIPAGSSAARNEYGSGRGVLAIPDSQFDYSPAANNGYWDGSSNNSTVQVTTRLTPQNGGQ